ncbi:MAG: restriction endonuclease subunit S [Anaerolineae bacterium]|nr:restriction endonuclease subunit S [Anaerolineae bacterium]
MSSASDEFVFVKGLDYIPSDWGWCNFSDVCVSSQYGLSEQSTSVGTPYLGMSNLQDGNIVLDEVSRIALSEEDLEKYRLNKFDLIFNRTNSWVHVGKTALFDLEGDYVFASYLIRFVLDQNSVDPRFINYYFNSEYARRYVEMLGTKGVSQVNVNQSQLQRLMKIPLPPLDEQRRIADILSTWDEAITLTEQLIAALERRKKGLMQRLLTGEVRFPGFVQSGATQETRFGAIPVEWGHVQIGEVATEVSQKNDEDLDLTVLSCTKYEGLVDSLGYFGRQIFSDDTSTYKLVAYGQFAYATNHIEEGSIGYQDLYDLALISPMYTVFETDGELINDSYLYKLLKTELYRHIFEVNTSGTVNRRGSLRWNDFSRIRVPLPSIEEQIAISEVLEIADMGIELAEQRLVALKEQKKGLMQRLLTGQVRV